MTHLDDLFNPVDLQAAVDDGFVRIQDHPYTDLWIYNYTERAQCERVWTPVTLQCRGLIAAADGEVVARPWAKFFNYGEHPDGALDLNEPVEVTDKLDGSLGILYRTPAGELMIATRGSFTSDQAIHATQVLSDNYGSFEPPYGETVLFEIVYPDNRIVLDYGATDDLILLGSVDIDTGEAKGPAEVPDWLGPTADVFTTSTLASALALEPRRNAEGVVVRMLETGLMVKLKQDDYVQLHRLVTGMNARVVWERMGAGETVATICEGLPDEFHEWVADVGYEMTGEASRIVTAATADHVRIVAELGGTEWTRKEYAERAVKSEYRAWLFNLLDGRDPYPGIWRTLKPSGRRALVHHGEDVA